MVDLERVQCPSCLDALVASDSALRCQGCGREYPVTDGIAQLTVNPDLDTALDLAEYETDHPVDPDARARLFAVYDDALLRHGVQGGACLEIGSGTGNLTAGLVGSSTFSEVNCSDVSLRFLRRLRETVANDGRLRCWIFDAGRLPFRTGSMGAVFGHSVLHHLLDYEATLADVFRVLRPGGLAMFGEPVMDNHALTGFCAGLILELERRHPTGTFSEADVSTLELLRHWSATIGRRMRHHRQELAQLEDKHIYVVSDMLQLGRDLGFRSVEHRNAFTPERIGDDHFHQLSFFMDRLGSSARLLEPYRFVFQELSDTYGTAMGGAAPVNFGYFILQK